MRMEERDTLSHSYNRQTKCIISAAPWRAMKLKLLLHAWIMVLHSDF